MDAKRDIKDLPVDEAGATKVHGGGIVVEQRSIIDPNNRSLTTPDIRSVVPDGPERFGV
jgi:hypothetical protein